MPKAARTSAIAAKIPNKTAPKRSAPIDSPSSRSMVFTSAIGRSESRGTHNGGDAVGHAGGIAVRAHRHIYPGPRTLRKRHDDFRPLPILRVWRAHVLGKHADL